MDIEKKIEALKIVPVAAFADTAEAESKLSALCEGGLPIAEITFRTKAASDCIRLAREKFPQMLVGAGTVLNAEQAKAAIKAGAAFLVSPGMSKDVWRVSEKAGVPYFPGAVTPTEITRLIAHGQKIIKYFPANLYGGAAALRSLGEVFGGVRFMPTGGVSESNLRDYLALPCVFAVGGSWMMKGDVKTLTENAVKIVKETL